MHIRLLNETDADIYRALRLHGLRESPRAFTSSVEEFSQRTLDSIAQQLRGYDNFMLGAFEAERLVGMVGFYRESTLKLRHKGYIVSLYVLPDFRGRGIARALMVEVLARVRRLPDLDHVMLGVMETQTTARHLYESLGFISYGREPRAIKVGDEYVTEEWMLLQL